MSVDVIDFGCRLNLAEGASIAASLRGDAPRIVINSCAVTEEAVRQARQSIRRIARERPGVPIVVTGCAVATDGARFAAMPEVSSVVAKEVLRDDMPAVSGAGHARAFIEVQNGCDHECTFCVTTLARGPGRSHPVTRVVAAVAAAVERGAREAVLTGVDLTSYRPSLAELVSTILREIPALPRLRLSSLDPAEVDPALFRLLVDEPRLMPHVHLSLQSGDPLILKRMRRRHTPGQAADLVQRLKRARAEFAFGGDLIAGFPTETEAMHANSLAAIEACDLVFGHVFPYSPRPLTAAARMPQVSGDIARRRAGELRGAAQRRADAWRATLVGSHQNVLVERSGRTGHAPNFAAVTFGEDQMPGTIVRTKIVNVAGDRLIGVDA